MVYKTLFATTAIALWWIISLIINDNLIVPSPYSVYNTAYNALQEITLYQDIAITVIRSIATLLVSLICGVTVGIASGTIPQVKKLVEPIVTTTQATPSISWILIALMWVPTQLIAPLLIFISTTPLIILNTTEGVISTDLKLLEMAHIYKVPKKKVISNIYIPAVKGYVQSATTLSIGLAFKAGVMAEVLSRTGKGVGERMAQARIDLDMSALFFYTIVIVTLSLVGTQLVNRSNGEKKKERSIW